MVRLCRAVAESALFQFTILAIILFNAVLIGVETYDGVVQRHAGPLHAANLAIQVIFLVEIAVRLLACAPRLHRFFLDGWNVFDFTVVALSLLPAAGPAATVARLARVLRVARLVSVSAELRLIVATMLRSIPSMLHVITLLTLLLYVYAVIGLHLFRAEDASHWGSLDRAVLSTFQMLTLEGWVEMQQAVIDTHPWAWIYFGSFIIFGVFVIVNLFIAVVLNNLDAAKDEQRRSQDRDRPEADLLRQMAALREQIEALENRLRAR
ncbi:MAG: ion transporter [Candidatus Sumerlaeia bacterium]|nr:ion transporter [Candidatus Sumerlaeia bacterium]